MMLSSAFFSPATTMLNDGRHISELYAGVDYTSLSYAEQLWMSWYLWIGDVGVATGLAAFIMHEVVYFGRSLVWVILDLIPYFQKYKIQRDKPPTAKEQWECIKFVLLIHFTVEIPQIWLFHPLATAVGMKTYHVPFPSYRLCLQQNLIFVIIEDTWHYWAHRFLHYGFMYKYIHKVHHKYSAPFCLAVEYAHPLEILILGMGTIGGPLVLCAITGNVHLVTVYIWVALRMLHAVDAHSGYDFPWSPRHFVPFWAGPEFHDFHHMSFVNNYGSIFRWFDSICGTDDRYRAHKSRLEAVKDQDTKS